MTTRNGLMGFVAAAALAALPLAAFAAPPTVTITEGPDEGGTVTEESVTFAFDTTEAETTRCSITGADDDESFFSCGSPQTYELPNGEYRFVVEVSNDDGTETAERTFSVAIEDDGGDGGSGDEGSDEDTEEESSSSSSGGGIVRYQTPIYPDRPKVAIRPGTVAIVPSAENPYVSLASVTPVPQAPQAQVAGAQTTTPPRTTATAPRSTVTQAPRTTTTTTTPAPTTTPTTTVATTTATSAPFGVATTVPAGAALGALDGGIPNWFWAALVALVVVGVAGYAWSTTREV
ncbi:hypothetical protein IT396_01740 [Candidatus Nomurabacteria bacterium]|nr:hypothetical protein [Candidatus Nomurabacteria bacterium]